MGDLGNRLPPPKDGGEPLLQTAAAPIDTAAHAPMGSNPKTSLSHPPLNNAPSATLDRC